METLLKLLASASLLASYNTSRQNGLLSGGRYNISLDKVIARQNGLVQRGTGGKALSVFMFVDKLGSGNRNLFRFFIVIVRKKRNRT